jgi:LmeA-like phospholipid-binding
MASRGMRGGSTGGRRARRWIITLAVIVVVLVVLDFAARVVAQNVMATKIEQQGLSRKPTVSIGGFPFLTQVASKDFSQVNISVADLTEGPVTITSVKATAHGIRLNSFAFNSGTVSTLSGTALISFASLGNALTTQVGPLGSLLNGAGLQLSQAGPSEVKASLDLVVTSGSATWRVSRLSGNKLNVHLVSTGGSLPASLLSSIRDVTLKLPKLPLGLSINSISVTPQGVTGRVSGHNVSFGG